MISKTYHWLISNPVGGAVVGIVLGIPVALLVVLVMAFAAWGMV